MILVRKLEQAQEIEDDTGRSLELPANLFSSSQSSFFELDDITPSMYMHQNAISATKTLGDLHLFEGTKRIVESTTAVAPVAAGVILDNIRLSESNV